MTRRVLLFAGTTEGREIAAALLGRGMALTVCVATDYGQLALAGLRGEVDIRTGRLSAQQMDILMGEGYACAIDATHPYAAEATRNIAAAARAARLPLYRLLREQGAADAGIAMPTAEAAAEALRSIAGNVLLTTGSKELCAFAQGFADRCYPRILPTVENLQRCLDLGYHSSRIIAMQGPFSRALNEAMLRQFKITCLVTKNSGRAGGYLEKVEAAQALGVQIITISRPQEGGQPLRTVQDLLAVLEGGSAQ